MTVGAQDDRERDCFGLCPRNDRVKLVMKVEVLMTKFG